MSRPTRIATDPYEQAHVELIDRCLAYVPVAPEHFRFSHVTAARLYRMPLPDHLMNRAQIDVSTPAGTGKLRSVGVIGHRVTDCPVRLVKGLPVISPEFVFTQLGTLLTLDELVIAGDHLVRRKLPFTNMSKLTDAVARLHRTRGSILVRAALADVRPGTDSPRESLTRLIIVRGGLPEPVIRHEVIDPDGYFVGTPDLAYVDERIAIEYEGQEHRKNRKTYRDDIARREAFEAIGWRVILVVDEHTRDPRRLVNRIEQALADRAPH